MKSILLFVIALGLTAGARASDSLTINVGGVNRGLWVHVPPSYAAGQHLPLVFNFHGYSSNASQEELYTQMDNTADTAKFILVYPSGLNAAWNVGWAGSLTGPDDVAFTSAMIDTLIKLYAIDSTRVYSCGMSNGGFMSHLLASVLSNRITAIAAVSGTVTDSAAALFNQTRKVPVMDIHGTMDPVVPYDSSLLGVSLTVEQTINFWLGHYSCGTPGDTTFIANTDTGDSSTVQKIDYPACAGGAEVLFYKIINGGHTWPNGIIDIPVASYGFTNRDIDANTEIWHFFNKYRMNTTTGVSELIEPKEEVQISPNPLAGQSLRIAFSDAVTNAQVQITDANGRLVFTNTTSAVSNMLTLDLPAGMAKGVYLVRVATANAVVVKKLVKL